MTAHDEDDQRGAGAPRVLVELADLTPDSDNANLGTERGRAALEHSLRTYGAGRSVLADRDGRLIAGNKTIEVAAELGIPIRTIQTDGNELIVVQRTDLTLAEAGPARELAWFDNRVGQLDLSWSPDAIHQAALTHGGALSPIFTEDEMAAIIAGPLHDAAKTNPLPTPGDAATSSTDSSFGVIIECDDEATQLQLLAQMMAAGYRCRALFG